MILSDHIRAAGLLAALSIVALAPGARADGASDALRRAAGLARTDASADAVAALPPLTGLTREHLAPLGEAAKALQSEQPVAASRLYAAMRRIDPNAAAPRVGLEALWERNPTPPVIEPDDLPLLPVDADTMALPACPPLAATSITTLSVKPVLASEAAEPRSGEAFPNRTAVYCGKALRFVVYHGPWLPAARAAQVGRLLGALSVASDAMMGASGRNVYPVHVWLSNRGKPGAEQWGRSIVAHASAAERSDLEWARELAHEWGHASIPGVGGFTKPEAWANGDLGERLYLPLLQESGWLRCWSAGLDASAYVARYVDPPRDAFAATGPVPRLVRDASEAGYRHFLGAALYVRAAYGDALLAEALGDMDEATTTGFLSAISRAVGRRKEAVVRRAPGPPGPRPICFAVPGSYTLIGLPARAGRLPAVEAGWTMLNWDGPLTVRTGAGLGGNDHGCTLQVRAPRAHRQQ